MLDVRFPMSFEMAGCRYIPAPHVFSAEQQRDFFLSTGPLEKLVLLPKKKKKKTRQRSKYSGLLFLAMATTARLKYDPTKFSFPDYPDFPLDFASRNFPLHSLTVGM